MSAFEKSVHIEPVTGGGFVVGLNHTPGFMSERMAFTNAADLLAWVTRELAPSTDLKEARVKADHVIAMVNATNKPSDPSTAPTVAPYEGCWAVLRNGEVFGPLRRDNHPSYPFEYDGEDGYRCWTASGGSLVYRKASPRDIIAVHPSDPRITPETPSDDGWIEWKGGECPVGPKAFVAVKYRSPARPEKGIRIEWDCPAGQLAWHHDGEDDDIVAYRLSRPSK